MREPRDIEFERLADWVEGRLPEEEARAVEKRVAEAGEPVRAEVEWLRAFARMSEDTVLASPPPEVHEDLLRRFEGYAREKRRPGILERLVATLSFDGGLQPAFGVRSARAQESQRQLVYSTDAADIALNVSPRGGLLDLDGQVFPTGEDETVPFSVQLLDDRGAEVGVTATDELGEFAFEAVAPGTYQILLGNGRVEILILPVDLRL